MKIPEVLQGLGAIWPLIVALVLFVKRRRIFDFARSKVVLVTERDSALVQLAQAQAAVIAAERQAADWKAAYEAAAARLALAEGEHPQP